MQAIADSTRVLVVDDDPFVLKLLSRQLAQLGYRDVATFEHASSALDLLEHDKQAVDLIVSDLQMPGMDGIEFLRKLGRARYGGRLLLVSGEEQRVLQSARRLAQLQGLRVVGVLNKPASGQQLKAQLSGRGVAAAADTGSGGENIDGFDDVGHIEGRAVHDRCSDELRDAVAAGALVTHFQPKVRFSDGALCGVEALLRWRHPDRGLLPVDRLLRREQAEDVASALVRIALGDALEQSRRWYDAGLDVAVAVNLSSVCLASLDLPEIVERTAERAGVALSRVVLQLTQAQMRTEPVPALDVLTRLRLKGVALSIDDFGAGDASLLQLRDVPFGELKLGPALVHGVAHDRPLQAIVGATLSMARQLGLGTVAQGVRDASDWVFLREHGCDAAQGPFVGMPVPAAALTAWRGAWEARRAALCDMAVE